MKRSIIPVAAFIAGMAIVPSVFAAEYTPDQATGFKSCLANTIPGTVCTLDGDMTLNESSAISVTSDITLDLNGHKLYLTGSSARGIEVSTANGKLTVRNGEIVNNVTTVTGGTLYVKDAGAKLNIENSATISGVTPVVVRDGASEVTVAGTLNNNVKGASGAAALWVHGAADGSTVTLTGTARLLSTVGAGLFQTGAAKTTANAGAVITGKTGIVIKTGELTLNGATVTGDGAWDANVKTATSGYDKLTGAAIQIEGDNNEEITKIDIDNSVIESKNGSPFISYADASNKGTVKSFTVDNSYLKAKDGETVLMAKSTAEGKTDLTWTAYSVDGSTTFKLATEKGEYGTKPADIADEGEEGKENENPNTADTIVTYLTIAAVALLGLCATAFVAKKSNR